MLADLELGSVLGSPAIEGLGEDAVAIAALIATLPGDDERSVAADRHGRVTLVVRGVRVHLELAAERGRLSETESAQRRHGDCQKTRAPELHLVSEKRRK